MSRASDSPRHSCCYRIGGRVSAAYGKSAPRQTDEYASQNRTDNGTESARCEACGAKLSRYREPGATRCAPCAKESADAATRIDHAPGYCKRGHDLNVYGVIQRAEGDRYSRRCGACQRIRAAEYAHRRRARLRAIRNGDTSSIPPSIGEQARARYEADTLDMQRLRAAGVSISEIARRVGARPNTISARLARANRKAAA